MQVETSVRDKASRQVMRTMCSRAALSYVCSAHKQKGAAGGKPKQADWSFKQSTNSNDQMEGKMHTQFKYLTHTWLKSSAWLLFMSLDYGREAQCGINRVKRGAGGGGSKKCGLKGNEVHGKQCDEVTRKNWGQDCAATAIPDSKAGFGGCPAGE